MTQMRWRTRYCSCDTSRSICHSPNLRARRNLQQSRRSERKAMSRRNNNVRGPTSALTEFLRVCIVHLCGERTQVTADTDGHDARKLASTRRRLRAVQQRGIRLKLRDRALRKVWNRVELSVCKVRMTVSLGLPPRQAGVADDDVQLLYVHSYMLSLRFDWIPLLEFWLCVRST